jgi:hypothetical protein
MNPELISGQFHKVSLSCLGFLEDLILFHSAAGFSNIISIKMS